MTKRPWSKIFASTCLIGVVLAIGYPISGISAGLCEDGVTLQVSTDKSSYAPGEKMRVRFLITNIGTTPLYLFRDSGQCSSPYGSLSISLQDSQNRIIDPWQCSFDDFSWEERDYVEILNNANSGLFLRQNEIYGMVVDYELPIHAGIYQVRAELSPAALTKEQTAALARHEMRILHGRCSVSVATITVRKK